ncbi:WD40 repeat-like protein [Jaminaea rosea]|uniref:WD40 repeat-like protein n=1 Tax=Jaminaea rosea TaxID=1569628 RepID=A0A316UVT4_9BASI|nr:WD40 repeat-like protein [Jaminaea rosea]PWN28441.1 WD40 repeat-like protein [Jaminaea rosea]
MNQSLLNPFATPAIPESVHQVLAPQTETACLCARFNPRGLFAGQYIAAARADCAVAIYDLETRSLVRFLEGHVRPVTSLDWSSTGRFLVSGSMDWNVVVWDLKKREGGARTRTIRFDAPVSQVTFAPGTSRVLLVVLESQQAIVVDLRRKKRRRMAIPSEASSGQAGPSKWQTMELKIDLAQRHAEESGEDDAGLPPITAALFHPSGAYIFAGTTRGEILAFSFQDSPSPSSSSATCRLIARSNISGSSAIREMALDRSGRSIVVNSNDRSIRVIAIEVPPLSPINKAPPSSPDAVVSISTVHRFQDLVNRTPWNGVGFSGDGEYIYAGAAHQAAHNVYIWDRGSGILDKILEGPREPLVDADWHPVRPLILSVNVSGSLNVWFTPNAENWSAYAPGFEELEENVEYEEGEDEFDLEDEEEERRRRENDEEEGGEIDLWTLVGAPAPARGVGGTIFDVERRVKGQGDRDGQKMEVDEEQGADEQWQYAWAEDEELDGEDFALHVVLQDFQSRDYRDADTT